MSDGWIEVWVPYDDKRQPRVMRGSTDPRNSSYERSEDWQRVLTSPAFVVFTWVGRPPEVDPFATIRDILFFNKSLIDDG